MRIVCDKEKSPDGHKLNIPLGKAGKHCAKLYGQYTAFNTQKTIGDHTTINK